MNLKYQYKIKGNLRNALHYLYDSLKVGFSVRYINGFIIKVKYGQTGDIYIDEYSYGNIEICAYSEYFKIEIGKYVSISDIAMIIGGNHHMDISTYPFRAKFDKTRVEEDNSPSIGIKIGNDVWIGYGAVIMDGANIGTGAIIGAGTVVRGTIPPYSVVIGNPGKVIKYRFSETEIDMLLKSKWWDLPLEKLKKVESYLYSKDIDSFIRNVDILKNTV